MAGRDLIEQYLEQLRAGLAGRSDASQVVDEVNDHLRSHVERLTHDVTDSEAQKQALHRLGDPRVLATMFRLQDKPDRFGDQARAVFGAVGFLAALCWVAVAFAPNLFPGGDGFNGGTISVAILSTAVFLIGVNWRSGQVQPVWAAVSIGAVLIAVLIVVDFRVSVSYGGMAPIVAGVFTAIRCGWRRRRGEFWASLAVALAVPVSIGLDVLVFLPAGLPYPPIAPTIIGLALLTLALLYRHRLPAAATDAAVGVPS